LPSPWKGRAVRAGQAITMFSPSPCWFFLMRFSRPSPKAMSSATETVPQVMPSRVSSVRTFWWRTSCRICLRKEREVTFGREELRLLLDLLGRPLHHQLALLQARGDLHVDPVGEADLDLPLHRLLGRAGHLHGGL